MVIFSATIASNMKVNGDRIKTLLIKEYLDEIKPCLKEIINNLKKSDTWKIQLTVVINFISSKDIDKECVMHSKSDNIKIMNLFLNHLFLANKLGWKHQ